MKLLLVLFILYTQLFSHNSYSDSILKGSPESLIKQNQEADESNLTRIENNQELKQFIESGLLVKIPKTPGVRVDRRLASQFHFVRPWTAEFLSDLGNSFRKRFNSSLQINSATRTVERQGEIAKTNRNAAPTVGNMRSSHLTGSSIDISKKTLTLVQKKWLREQLKKLERGDKIEATEEHYQAVFHVMVFERYQQRNVQIAFH